MEIFLLFQHLTLIKWLNSNSVLVKLLKLFCPQWFSMPEIYESGKYELCLVDQGHQFHNSIKPSFLRKHQRFPLRDTCWSPRLPTHPRTPPPLPIAYPAFGYWLHGKKERLVCIRPTSFTLTHWQLNKPYTSSSKWLALPAETWNSRQTKKNNLISLWLAAISKCDSFSNQMAHILVI